MSQEPTKRVVLLKGQLRNSGGLEKVTHRIADAFVKKGCDVTLLTTGDVTGANRDGIEYISLGTPQRLSICHLWQYDRACRKWLDNHKWDVVFGLDRNSFQTHYRAGNGVHAAYLQQRRLTDSYLKLASFRLNPLHQYILHLERCIYENPQLQRLFTNSCMVRDEILQHYKTDPNKIHVIHNGVEWTAWQEAFDEWQNKRSRSDPFHFLFVGHGYRRKGLQFLLEACSRMKSESFVLTVIGNDREEDWFKARAQKLGLQDKVRFLGKQPPLQFYQAADALVIPSTYDPFANVTVEALAMGLFVVSSKYNGGSEVLTNDSGVVIEELTDPDSVAAALKIAMKHPKTPASALIIRNSVRHLDYTNQLEKLMTLTLST